MLTINADDLPRFMVCNGSRLMAPTLPPSPDIETSARDEGNAAHYMATRVFNQANTLEELVDRKAPNGVYMTSDMAEHVDDYLTAIETPEATVVGMEMETSHDFAAGDHSWVVNGRSDFITHHIDRMRIVDFKYGWRIVNPEHNWTLISHAIGFWKQNQTIIHPHTQIELCIFQPRPYHPDGPFRKWPIMIQTLELLYQELTKTLCNPKDELRTSNHCGKCPALVPCPSARMAEMNAIDVTESVYQDDVSNDLLSFNLDNLNRAQQMIEARLKAYEELAQHRIKAGQVVDNYSVGTRYGNSRWKEGIDGPMLELLTGKVLSTAKTVMPAEAKRRGVDPAIIATLTERLVTGIKLERVSANKKAERLLGTK